jgi:hypothetical protein
MRACNDAANLEMGPGNDAGASTDSVGQPGPKEVSTKNVRGTFAEQSASSISSILKCELATTLARLLTPSVSKLDQ